MNETIECPCCHTKLDCEIETEIIGLRDWQDVEVQTAITSVWCALLARHLPPPTRRPIIVLQPDDSDLYDRGLKAGRRQAQAEASDGRWKGER